MYMKHERKVETAEFNRIKNGEKTFIQLNEAEDFQKGDEIKLLEWNEKKINKMDNAEKGFTGQALEFTIGFVEHLTGHTAILSLLPPKSRKG